MPHRSANVSCVIWRSMRRRRSHAPKLTPPCTAGSTTLATLSVPTDDLPGLVGGMPADLMGEDLARVPVRGALQTLGVVPGQLPPGEDVPVRRRWNRLGGQA